MSSLYIIDYSICYHTTVGEATGMLNKGGGKMMEEERRRRPRRAASRRQKSWAAQVDRKTQPSVVVAALEDDQGRPLLVKAIHKAVLLIDAAGPASHKVKAEQLRLAKAFKRIAERITQQLIDALHRPFVGHLPVQIIFPRLGCPGQQHGQSSRSCCTVLPASAACNASRNRAALAGERSR